GIRIANDTIAVAGLASGGKGVSRVVVTLNGMELMRIEPPTPSPAVPLNLGLSLREGANTLVITVSDASGAVREEVRTVHYERSVPLAIHVSYPGDQLRVSQDSTVVVASAASSRGVARLGITVNGADVQQGADGGGVQQS